MTGVVLIADSKGKGYGFAKGIYEYVRGKERRDFEISLTDIKKTIFKDDEFKVRINDNIRRRICFFIHDSNKNPCEWFTELAFTLQAMGFSSPSEINLVLPYTRFARQDRKDESRVSVNAKAVADVVSLYANRGLTVDLHAPGIQQYFKIPFDNLYSMPVLLDSLQKKHPEILEDLVVVSPDAGGGKRVESLVKRLAKRGINADVAYGNKQRTQENKVEKSVVIGDVENKNCLVVDDMIDTGGTLVGVEKVLREKKAKAVYAYGTHGLFTEGIDKLKGFDKVFTSDTLCCNESKNIEIISLSDLFGEAVFRTVKGESLSDLFDDGKN